MAWEKINDMFPNGGITNQGVYLTNNQIKSDNLPVITEVQTAPVRHKMIEYEEALVWYPDGDMFRHYLYHVFPQERIDTEPLFNVYWQKAYNDYMEKIL